MALAQTIQKRHSAPAAHLSAQSAEQIDVQT